MKYKIIYSERRTLALQIKRGELIVRAPKGMSAKIIEEFVTSHAQWIEKHLPTNAEVTERLSDCELSAIYDEAKRVIPMRVAYFADRLGVDYRRITIRCQSTRWGSCSTKGNLNFNCLLMLAPSEVLDSVIAHELCHRKQMNHSKEFYALLLSVCPDYYHSQAWLKQNGSKLMGMAGK